MTTKIKKEIEALKRIASFGEVGGVEEYAINDIWDDRQHGVRGGISAYMSSFRFTTATVPIKKANCVDYIYRASFEKKESVNSTINSKISYKTMGYELDTDIFEGSYRESKREDTKVKKDMREKGKYIKMSVQKQRGIKEIPLMIPVHDEVEIVEEDVIEDKNSAPLWPFT